MSLVNVKCCRESLQQRVTYIEQLTISYHMMWKFGGQSPGVNDIFTMCVCLYKLDLLSLHEGGTSYVIRNKCMCHWQRCASPRIATDSAS